MAHQISIDFIFQLVCKRSGQHILLGQSYFQELRDVLLVKDDQRARQPFRKGVKAAW